MVGLQVTDVSSYEHVMVLCTARRHARGVQRLPDRFDRGRRVAAIQVESADDARLVLGELDRTGVHLYLDAERKQEVSLLSIAREVVRHAGLHVLKPNDLTVDALQAVVEHQVGVGWGDLRPVVYGTGNLAAKFSLRLAELGAAVTLMGRNPDKVRSLAATINAILPTFTEHRVETRPKRDHFNLLVSAVTAEAVIDDSWTELLAAGALCIDVGIDNFAPGFIQLAQQVGHTCMRLDVRSAGDPLPAVPNAFFDEVAGRSSFGEFDVVAGGYIGRRGDLVLDRIRNPTRVIGVANGTGGLLRDGQLSNADAARLERVRVDLDVAHQEGVT